MNFRVETFVAPELPEDTVMDLAVLRCLIYPDPAIDAARAADSMRQTWRGYDGPARDAAVWFIAREPSGRVVANAIMYPKHIRTPQGPLDVAGLASVMSHPEVRGQGYGNAVVAAAFEWLDRSPYNWSLFQTSYGVRPFYERLGARLIDNLFVNSTDAKNPTARPWWNDVTMIRPAAHCNDAWPEGQIDLLGKAW